MALDTCCCSGVALRRRLPVLAWLPNYSLQWLKLDFIAGLSVGLTVIPQALAYAEVAGLPPQVKWLTPRLLAPFHSQIPPCSSVSVHGMRHRLWIPILACVRPRRPLGV